MVPAHDLNALLVCDHTCYVDDGRKGVSSAHWNSVVYHFHYTEWLQILIPLVISCRQASTKTRGEETT
jgi:hypothetical protein